MSEKVHRDSAYTQDGRVRVSITLPVKLVETIDSKRDLLKITRSDWITSAIRKQLSLEEKTEK